MKKIPAKLICFFIKNKNKRNFIYNLLINKTKLANYMPPTHKKNIGYTIQGKNNKIILIENGIERLLSIEEKIKGLEISIKGNNNLIRLKLPINAENSKIEIGNDNVSIEIGNTSRFFNVFIRCCFGCNQTLKIGKNTTISGANIILDAESKCIIGEDCKISNSIRIWASDGHAILDAHTLECINETTEPIVIGNHVWIGEAVRITKNARVVNNCILGGGSVIRKNYAEDNVIIAGNPGKIIKRGITWDRRNPYDLKRIKK